jgi:hypothetical protein
LAGLCLRYQAEKTRPVTFSTFWWHAHLQRTTFYTTAWLQLVTRCCQLQPCSKSLPAATCCYQRLHVAAGNNPHRFLLAAICIVLYIISEPHGRHYVCDISATYYVYYISATRNSACMIQAHASTCIMVYVIMHVWFRHMRVHVLWFIIYDDDVKIAYAQKKVYAQVRHAAVHVE